jgi:hypothetical protein
MVPGDIAPWACGRGASTSPSNAKRRVADATARAEAKAAEMSSLLPVGALPAKNSSNRIALLQLIVVRAGSPCRSENLGVTCVGPSPGRINPGLGRARLALSGPQRLGGPYVLG